MVDARIEAVCDEGWIIYCDWKKRNDGDGTFKDLDYQSKYEYYMKQYTDFARQYPIILRYLASFGMYNSNAVRKYLKKCNTSVITTDEDYADRQADFVKFLWMETKPHMDKKKLDIIWQQTRDEMLREITARKVELQKIKDIREKNKISNNIKRVQNVRERIARIGGEEKSSTTVEQGDDVATGNTSERE